jgi:hypothetical protein
VLGKYDLVYGLNQFHISWLTLVLVRDEQFSGRKTVLNKSWYFSSDIPSLKMTFIMSANSSLTFLSIFTRTNVNQLIWNWLSPYTRSYDVRIQQHHNVIIKASINVVKMLDKLDKMKINKESSGDEQFSGRKTVFNKSWYFSSDIPSLKITFIMSANSSLTFLSTFYFSLKLKLTNLYGIG